MKRTQPSQIDIDANYIFGTNFNFELYMDMVRPLEFKTTNQHVTNEGNAKTLQSKLHNKRD